MRFSIGDAATLGSSKTEHRRQWAKSRQTAEQLTFGRGSDQILANSHIKN